ncbi:hypothetical protein [Streptomyces nodosus]|uniref:hypothetical protein n=1 Tax=Streptomyces nodosus TaxID=40318 RepID=UPI00382EFF45
MSPDQGPIDRDADHKGPLRPLSQPGVRAVTIGSRSQRVLEARKKAPENEPFLAAEINW